MRETGIIDSLNCKTQVYARVCEDNKLEEKAPIEIIYGNRCKFEGSYGKSGIYITMIFSRVIHHYIKVLVLLVFKTKILNLKRSRE